MKTLLKISTLFSFGFAVAALGLDERAALKKQTSYIYDIIETNYGPLDYKQSRGLDWNVTKVNALTEIDSLTHSRDYYFMMARFFSQLNDAHVSVSLPSNYKAELPIQFSYVEGKTILNWLSSEVLARCQASVGDELTSFDGKTPDQLRQEFSKYLNVGKERSNLSYLTRSLTVRNEARGLPVSNMNLGESELMLYNPHSYQTVRCVLPWKITGSPLIGRKIDPSGPSQKDWLEKLGIAENSLTYKVENFIRKIHMLINTQVTHLADGNGLLGEKENQGRGIKQSLGRSHFAFALPKDATPLKIPALMTPIVGISGSGLKAFIVPYKGKKVGVLRIPSYMGTMIAVIPLELRFLIGKLEKEADLLLIDQTHNPGGAVAYSDWLVSALAGQLRENAHMKFLVRPRQSFMRMYVEIMDLLKDETMVPQDLRFKYEPKLKHNLAVLKKAYESGAVLSEPVDLSVFSELVQEIVDATLFARLREIPFGEDLGSWISGKLLDGVDITRHQTFTKPVYMLVDELDFSGGDATPAVLQDYGRVKIVGVETAGAGGTVEEFKDFMSGFGFNLTTSLMYRKNGVFVENLGVRPDIAVEPTVEDYRNNFRDYFTTVMEKIGI